VDEDFDPDNPFPDPVELPITDTLDLHTVPPRDARAVVEAYLEAAAERGFRHVRIIHGKGIGLQREMVHKCLSKHRLVGLFHSAPEDAGGWGATLAELVLKEPSTD
jgi:DNA-nicking Smr family endonuclease